MIFRHLLITRFSYRGRDALKEIDGPTFYRDKDPLDPERLDRRFKLFEIACLPSILAQSEQNFAWIILVDNALPPKYLDRLRSLTESKKDRFIHAFDPRLSLARLEWLAPYLGEFKGHVITTNLDDDDSLPTRYVAGIHQRLGQMAAADRLPLIGIMGARQIVQWDLRTSRDRPLGSKASWHTAATVASAGLTLFCKVPEIDLCVLALRHRRAEAYVDFSKRPADANVRWFQDAIATAAQAIHVDVRTWNYDDLFHDISKELGPVLMTNHVDNDQAQRLFERKPDLTLVTGPSDFPHLPINWEKARTYAPCFGATEP
jgi:hypothetical protein